MPVARAVSPNAFSQRCQLLALSCLTVAAFCVGITTTGTSVAYVLAFLFALCSGCWLRHFDQLRHNPALLSFWMLFALYAIGMTYSQSPPHQAFHDLQKMHWLLMTPFFAALFDAQAERWRRRLLNAFLLAMSITLLLSFAKAGGVPLPSWISRASANNVFFEHIVQTFFLSIAAFLAIYRACYETHHRLLYAGLSLLITVNIFFFSESATGFVSYSVLLAYVLAKRFGVKGLLLSGVIALGLAGTAMLGSPLVKERLHTVKREYHDYHAGQTISSLGLRLAMWENASSLLHYEPWFGYGTGGIKQPMQDHLTPAEIARTGLLDYVEISPLNFILQFGIFGLVALITLLWFQFKTAGLLPEPYRSLMQAFLLAYLAASLFNCFFISFCETHWYALVAAICFSTYTAQPQGARALCQSSLSTS